MWLGQIDEQSYAIKHMGHPVQLTGVSILINNAAASHSVIVPSVLIPF